MQRSQPLQRRTGLRSSAALSRGATPARRTRIKPMSAKARAQIPARKACREVVLECDPICRRCGTAPSVHVHEILTRARGGSPLDPANCAGLCAACHDWLHLHPAEAEAIGLMQHSWAVA